MNKMSCKKTIKILMLTLCMIFSVFSPIHSLLSFNHNNYSSNIINKDSFLRSEKYNSINPIKSNQKLETRANPKFGEKIYQLCQNCQNNEVSTVKFAPNMKLIAGGTDHGEILIWDITTSEKLFTIKGSQNKIKNVLWTPDSLTIISVYRNAIINFWNVSNGNLNFQADLGSKIGDIKHMDISHDGHLLAVTSTDEKFSLWSVDEPSQKINFLKYLSENTTFESIDVQFSPKDDQIALYLITTKILIWKWEVSDFNLNITKNVGILNYNGYNYYKGNAIDFSSDGKTLYITLLNGNVYLLDTSTGELETPLNPKRTSYPLIIADSVSIAGNNDMIAYASTYCLSYQICPSQGFEIFDQSTNKTILESTDGTTTTVEMSKDGSMLATIGLDQTVTIWNTILNSEVKSLTGHLGVVWETDFLNETILVSSSADSVRIWNNGIRLKSLEGDKLNNTHPAGVAITETLNSDILVAFGTQEGKVILYNYTDDSTVELLGHIGKVAELDFSPDGSLLASAGNIAIKIWNTSTHSLFNDIPYVSNEPIPLFYNGVEFLSNTKLVVSAGFYGVIYLLDINGTKTRYSVSEGHGAEPTVLAFDLSEDKTLVGAFIQGGYIVLLNLTSGQTLMDKKLSIFTDELTNSAYFADVDFTPDKRYIIFCSGFRHTLYFIDTQDLTVKHSIFLNIQHSFRTKLEPKTWTLSVSKDDYSVSLYDMSPLKTDNFDVFDFDSDGMSDFWEQNNLLSSNWYWDRFDDPDNDELVNWEEYLHKTNPQSVDSDGDAIFDTYEVKYGLDPNKDDSLLDKDGDGMNNLFEFKMGLDSSVDDSALDPDLDGLSNLQEFQHQTNIHKSDTDDDGMPDKWEVENGLNPIDSQDATKDNDLDGISNLEEYRHRSNPNNFFSVPLISLNYFYLMIVLGTVILVSISYYQYRRHITDTYSAPDYSSAVKAKQAGLDSWYEYTVQENSVSTRLQKAHSLLLEGLVNQSVLEYQSIIDDLQLLGKEVESAEVLSKLLFIESKLLKIGNIQQNVQKIPKKGSAMLLAEYRKIIEGYILDSTNNPGLALANWNQVLKSETKLSPEHNLMVKHAIIDTMITSYQVERSQALFTKINQSITSLIKEAKNKGYSNIVCGAYLLSARILFYNYQLKDAMKVLDQVTLLAKNNKFSFFIELVSTEVENFEKIKSSIKEGLALKDKTIAEDDEALKDYVHQARKLVVEFKET